MRLPSFISMVGCLGTLVGQRNHAHGEYEARTCTIINGGGTIVGAADSASQSTEYEIGSTSVNSVVEVLDFGNIDVTLVDLVNKGSHDYTDQDLFTAYRAVYSALEDNGCVVFLCGTDAMSVIAAWFTFVKLPPRSVLVLSGASRPHTALGADGPLHVLLAARLGVHRRSRGRGVLATFGNSFGYALLLRKLDSITVEAYKHSGRLGRYVNDEPIFDSHPAELYNDYTFDLTGVAFPPELPNVPVLYAHHGVGTVLFMAAIADNARAVVLDGMGAGSWPTESLIEMTELAASAGVRLIFSSQCPHGFVDKFNSCGSLETGQCRLLVQLMLWLKPHEFDVLCDKGKFRGHILDVSTKP